MSYYTYDSLPERQVLLKTSSYEVFIRPWKDNLVIIRIIDESITDAVPGRYPGPSRSDRTPNPEGVVNYYEEADAETVGDWKRKLGYYLTSLVIKPECERQGIAWTHSREQSILLEFPAGYKLFVHRKGDRHIPREDTYLKGSRYILNFRSPQEFILHLKWLLEGRPMKRDESRICSCCYCDTTSTQGDISRRYSLGSVPKEDGRKEKDVKKKEKGSGPVHRPSALRTVIQAKDYTKLHQSSTLNSPYN